MPDTLENIWGASTPKWIFKSVWGVVLSGFFLFAGRFAFVGLNFHGLPAQPGNLWFLGLAGISFATGWLQTRRAGLIYAAAFPVLLTVNNLDLLPFAQIPSHCLNFLAVGWLLRIFIFRKEQERTFFSFCRWSDFLVGCLGAAFVLATLYGLAQPNWRNSLSIAFSIFGWNRIPDEFEALWMGQNLLFGVVYYMILRHAVEHRGLQAAHKVILFQIFFVTAAWLVNLIYWKIAGLPETNTINYFPFLIKHDAAAFGLLGFGYMLGLVLFSSMKRTLKLLLACSCPVVFALAFFTGSKAGWFIMPVVLASALICWNWKKGLVLCLVFAPLLVMAGHLSNAGLFTQHIANNMSEINSDMSKDKNFTYRLQMYEDALRIWAAQPVAGAGVGVFGSLAPLIREKLHSHADGQGPWVSAVDYKVEPYLFAHNDYLDLLYSLGIAGPLVFVCFLFILMILTGFRASEEKHSHPNMAAGLFFALISYSLFCLFDSRLCQFNSAILFWAYAGVAAALATPGVYAQKRISRWGLWPVLAPLAILLVAPFQLASGEFMRNRDYGIWNFQLKDEKGYFLLAKEARFFVPVSDGIAALAFRLPQDSSMEKMEIRIAINETQPRTLAVMKSQETVIPFNVAAKGGSLTQVNVICEAWCGRGAFGSPLGVKPYALAMRKIQKQTEPPQ